MSLVELHADFERRNPDEADAEAAYEQARRVSYIAGHGSDEGYEPKREFPCPGALRTETDDASETHEVIRCDACGWLTTRRVPRPTKRTEEVSSW